MTGYKRLAQALRDLEREGLTHVEFRGEAVPLSAIETTFARAYGDFIDRRCWRVASDALVYADGGGWESRMEAYNETE